MEQAGGMVPGLGAQALEMRFAEANSDRFMAHLSAINSWAVVLM